MCQNAATIDGHLKTSQSYLHEWFIKMILFIHKRNYVYIKYEKDYIFMNFLQGLHFSRTSLVCFSLYYFNNVPCHFSKVHDSISLTTDVILFVHVIKAFIKYDYTVI